jgi:hypothetical protein
MKGTATFSGQVFVFYDGQEQEEGRLLTAFII